MSEEESDELRGMYVVKIFLKSGNSHLVEYGDEHKPFHARRIKNSEARKVIAALNQSYPQNTFLYVGRKSRSIYKIGIAADVERRAQTLGIEILGVDRFFNRKLALRFERKLHELYKIQGKHVRGEWFKLTDKDVEWLVGLHKWDQAGNEFNLDDMIEEAKLKLRKD